MSNAENGFADAIDLCIQKGALSGRDHRTSWSGPLGVNPADITVLRRAESGFGVLGVVVSAARKTYLHSAYPVAINGVAHRVRIVSVRESSFGLEACITAELGDAKINFFEPYYPLCSHLYRPGVELDVQLAAVAHQLIVPDIGQSVNHPEIGRTHLDGAAVLLPLREPAPEYLPASGFGLLM